MATETTTRVTPSSISGETENSIGRWVRWALWAALAVLVFALLIALYAWAKSNQQSAAKTTPPETQPAQVMIHMAIAPKRISAPVGTRSEWIEVNLGECVLWNVGEEWMVKIHTKDAAGRLGTAPASGYAEGGFDYAFESLIGTEVIIRPTVYPKDYHECVARREGNKLAKR